jgi:hypothetical protein
MTRSAKKYFVESSFVRVLAASLVLVLVGLGAAAEADGKGKIKKSQGRLVSLDREAKQMTVKVKGKKVVYNVKLDGSVMKRTTATMNARPARLEDIPIKAPVIVYWIQDESNSKEKFARKVDAPKIPKELLDDYSE